ncbi:hypothetical protein A2V47_00075 [Candidatus Atribacteria bacterium RBG_19FT_COMBO_35_14]|uniref:ABC transporter permease n=1 Tax=Candidatus Sediminicultor quintus TaxID=1797291 RepID=A0A1F5A7N4_9BACT|nr:MAG: hypothetical protein A2V47_00075 [Candidatus Atribacteria bacterium RBG_19FT_COMBO_35_14]
MLTRKIKQTLFDVNGIILLIAITILITILFFLSPNFLTSTNFRVILESMSVLTILSIGVHFLLVAGEIDISFASILSLSAAVAAVASPGNTFYLILVSLLAAVAVGVVNGFLTTKVGIPSFLVTLATMVGVKGIVYIVTDYRSVLLRNDLIPQIFFGKFEFVGNTATAVFWMIGLIVISGVILRNTRFGRWVYSTGGNTRAAMLMGIPTKRIKFTLFIISSVMGSIAGLIMVSRAQSARPLIGDGFLMPAIAAPILGGALLTGGRGSIIKTTLGCLLLTIINNGVNLLGLEPAYRDVIMGTILIVALSIRTLQQRSGNFLFRKRQPCTPSRRRE